VITPGAVDGAPEIVVALGCLVAGDIDWVFTLTVAPRSTKIPPARPNPKIFLLRRTGEEYTACLARTPGNKGS
jgi:hypothetical protein